MRANHPRSTLHYFSIIFHKDHLEKAIRLAAKTLVVDPRFDKQYLPENRKLLFNLLSGFICEVSVVFQPCYFEDSEKLKGFCV